MKIDDRILGYAELGLRLKYENTLKALERFQAKADKLAYSDSPVLHKINDHISALRAELYLMEYDARYLGIKL